MLERLLEWFYIGLAFIAFGIVRVLMRVLPLMFGPLACVRALKRLAERPTLEESFRALGAAAGVVMIRSLLVVAVCKLEGGDLNAQMMAQYQALMKEAPEAGVNETADSPKSDF